MLAQTTMTVVFGKLSDLYGRKPILMIGIAIFLVGSVFAGFATTMPAMIVFRLLQGIGAGAVQPVAMTVVADLYPARERGKVQGYLASVWAISAVVGPIAGSLIVHVVVLHLIVRFCPKHFQQDSPAFNLRSVVGFWHLM